LSIPYSNRNYFFTTETPGHGEDFGMSAFLEVLTALAPVCLAWWLLRGFLRPQAPADPAEDPFWFVPVPRGMGPKAKSGAVALEEPEEDAPADAYPPREL
jgi:hypothetical protein